MNLSSCRDLKSTVLARAVAAPGESRHLRLYRAARARKLRGKPRQVEAVETMPIAAVGIAPAGEKNYKLAVRVFRGFEEQTPELLRGLSRHEAEIDLATGVRYQPRVTMRAGGSIGHYQITAGTLGGFAEDDNHYYMVSNNHVFANSNDCFQGDPILEPGPADIQSNFRTVGTLHQWYPLSKIENNGVDVALARFSDAVDFFEPWDYSGIGRIGKQPVSSRFSVTRVIKRGRTTRVTRGTVSAYELDGVAIDYGTPSDPAIVRYDDQIEIIGSPPNRPFSQGGDSGSYIIDRDTMEVYALLYGGGPDSQGIDRTLAHFMPDVLKAMKIRLVQ